MFFMDYRFSGLLGFIVLILDILAIVEVLKSSRSMGSKLLWILLILFFPVVGLLIYYFAGRRI